MHCGASKTHLVLAHLVDTDPTYASFYYDRSIAGDFIMLDNSAYELKEPYRPEKLMELGKLCGATAIVLPDYPFQHSSKTIEAAEKFAPLFKSGGFATFMVPQSKRGDLSDWIACYEYAANSPLIDIIGMSILGIPNALPQISPAYARVVMTKLLQDRGVWSKKHHHFLGLNAGPKLEIPSLLSLKALDTVDSSNPIWMGILGHEYSENTDSLLSVNKVNMPVQFDLPYVKDPHTHRRISNNIRLTEQLFSQPIANTNWYAEE